MRPEIAIRIFDKCSWMMTLGCNPTISPFHVSPSSTSIDLSENLLSQKSPPFILANVFKCSGHAGQYNLQYTNKKFTDHNRKNTTDIIVRYALDNNINIFILFYIFLPTIALSIINRNIGKYLFVYM